MVDALRYNEKEIMGAGKDLRAPNSHRNADFSLLERGSVIHTVARHCRNVLAVVLVPTDERIA